MNLQTRLLLTYGYLVVVVVVGAVGAAWGFHDLGARIGDVLGENFESIEAGTAMLDSLERQDSAVLAALLEAEAGEQDLAAADELFRRSLERARANVTIAGEQDVIESLAASYEEYRSSREGLLASLPAEPVRAYRASTLPVFERVKRHVLELMDLNHEAMRQADVAAQRSARIGAALYGLLVGLAVLSLAPVARSLRRDVIDRIQALADVATVIAAGDRHRRASEQPNDELGVVARQLNSVLDRLQEAEATAAGELNRDRSVLRSLLEGLEIQGAVAARDGRLLAATLPGHLLPEIARILAEPGGDAPGDTVDIHGTHLSVRPLRGSRDRLLGWLVVETVAPLPGDTESA